MSKSVHTNFYRFLQIVKNPRKRVNDISKYHIVTPRIPRLSIRNIFIQK